MKVFRPQLARVGTRNHMFQYVGLITTFPTAGTGDDPALVAQRVIDKITRTTRKMVRLPNCDMCDMRPTNLVHGRKSAL